MTEEEAIKKLEWALNNNTIEEVDSAYEYIIALQMAIKALKQKFILDKIKAEILEEKEYAYADFEKYAVEYLDQEYEDDFRYGMERCLDIIDKNSAESEG
jgi:hypothetical protein